MSLWVHGFSTVERRAFVEITTFILWGDVQSGANSEHYVNG